MFKSSTAIAASLAVTKEDALDRLRRRQHDRNGGEHAGGTLAANALSLQLGVKETEPDAAATPGTTGNGSNIPAWVSR